MRLELGEERTQPDAAARRAFGDVQREGARASDKHLTDFFFLFF